MSSLIRQHLAGSEILTVTCFKAATLAFPQCPDETRPSLRHQRLMSLVEQWALHRAGALHHLGSRDVPVPSNTVDLCQTV